MLVDQLHVLFSGELGSNSRDILPPAFLKGIIFQIFFAELSTRAGIGHIKGGIVVRKTLLRQTNSELRRTGTCVYCLYRSFDLFFLCALFMQACECLAYEQLVQL